MTSTLKQNLQTSDKLAGLRLSVLALGMIVAAGCATQSTESGQKSFLTAQEHYDLGLALHAKGDLPGAIRRHGEAIKVDSRFVDAVYQRANARSARGELIAAIADYDRVVLYNAQYLDALYNRGNAKLRQRDFDGAIADYDSALKLSPTFVNAYVNRGNAKRDQGRSSDALADYEQALSIAPDNTYALAARSFMESLKNKASDPSLHKGSSSGEYTLPVRLHVAYPEYPLELREKKIEGDVLVEFIVTSGGDVVQAFAVSAPHPLMAEAAVRAVSAFKFTPGTKNGKAVHTRMRQMVTFDLKQVELKKNSPP